MGSMYILNHNYSPVVHRSIRPSAKIYLPECFTGTWLNSNKRLSLNYQFHHKQISAETRVGTTVDVPEVREDDDSTGEALESVGKIDDLIDDITMMLSTIHDGRISVSPYDTAFIALIKDVEGRNIPQFPSSLEWIAENQLPDGSWGDKHFFCAYDRLLNTLACVVALRSWNLYPNKSEKGILYIKENVCRLEDANTEHMTCGFEVIFPALLQRARRLGVNDIPYDAPVVREIYKAMDKKLKRIPMELMHKEPTSLLFSLEGLEDLNWEKLLKLQSTDGSFLTSPSSTAFAFMETKDEKCLKFIRSIVKTFNGGAPHTYPVDTFARLWAVDRLQRLGISRFFESEIKDCLSYIYSVWTDKGIFSGRDSEFVDIDDTSMGFRLLRLQGYDVDPNVFRNFKNGDRFSCYGGQMIESSSPIYNLYRASQLRFPGEQILHEANNLAYEFLQEKLAKNQLLDKWVISEHLSDEIKLGLEMPWYAGLPRLVSRFYIQHYAGADDVWIGKTLYRMEEISNNAYKELARLDFKRCQAQHQIEWFYMQEWYENYNVDKFGISRKELLLAYFVAASTIFEPERAKERIAWARSHIISKMITSFFNKKTTSLEQKNALVAAFTNNINGALHKIRSNKREHGLVNIIVGALHQIFEGFDRYISQQLKDVWSVWLMKLQGEANCWEDAELFVNTLNICADHIAFKEGLLSHKDYKNLCKLTNKICHQLSLVQKKKELGMEDWNMSKCCIKNLEVEQDMQALVKFVLDESSGVDRNIRQTFLSVAKTFYYSAYYDAETIDTHIFKVLFEPIV